MLQATRSTRCLGPVYSRTTSAPWLNPLRSRIKRDSSPSPFFSQAPRPTASLRVPFSLLLFFASPFSSFAGVPLNSPATSRTSEKQRRYSSSPFLAVPFSLFLRSSCPSLFLSPARCVGGASKRPRVTTTPRAAFSRAKERRRDVNREPRFPRQPLPPSLNFSRVSLPLPTVRLSL